MGTGTLRRLSLTLAAFAAATLCAFAEQAASPIGAPAAADEGNPLWAIASQSLSATRDRPLFSPSRRTPVVVAPPSPKAITAVETKPAAPEQPPFTLLGTIVGAEARLALVQNRSSNAVLRLHEGEAEAGWRMLKVDLRSIVLGKGANSTTLELPKPGQAGGNAPPDVPLAAADIPLVGAPIAAATPYASIADRGPRLMPKVQR